MAIDAYRPIGQLETMNAGGDSPPINCETLVNRCMNDPGFALSLITMFEATGKSYTDGILRHATEGNSHSAAEAAHCLKGVASIIGADALSEKATRAESAGYEADLVSLMNIADELRTEMARCLAYIPSLRIDLGQRSPT